MFLITVKNLDLAVYLVKKLIINNVAYTSKGSGVYIKWGWRIRPMDLYVQRADASDSRIFTCDLWINYSYNVK